MKITVPMMVLVAGLAAGSRALAQSGGSAASTTNTRSTTVLSDGTREVRVESDGATARVMVDGKQVASLDLAGAWTEYKVQDAGGNVVATLWRDTPSSTSLSAALGDQSQPMPGLAAPEVWRQRGAEWTARIERLMEDEEVRAKMDQARGQMERALARVGREMPRVMIGVTMSTPEQSAVDALGYQAENAVVVDSVVADGPAAKAGLREGDIIVGFNGSSSAGAEAIRELLAGKNPGDTVAVNYIRDGAVQSTTVALEPYRWEAFGQRFPGPGSAMNIVMFSDEEIERIQAEVAKLSEQLAQVTSELATAVGARAQELGKLAAEVGQQLAQQAAELARRSAAEFSRGFFPSTGGQATVRIVPDGASGQGVIVTPAPPAAPTPPVAAAPPSAELQQRLDRLEATNAELKALVEQLLEQQRKDSGGNH